MKSILNNVSIPSFLRTETPIILFGTFLIKVTKFIIFLYSAKTLGPELWGQWNILLLILMYASHYHLGLVNAFNREGPIFTDDKKYFKAIKKSIFSAVTILLLSSALLIMPILLLLDYVDSITLLLFTLYFISSQIYQWIETDFKVNIRFDRIAYYQIFKSAILITTSFYLINNYQIDGLLLSLALSEIILIFLNRNSITGFTLKFDFPLIKKYLKIGFPIMVVGLTFMLIHTVDRLIIIRFFSDSELGVYSIATIIFQIMLVFPQILAMQFYPRMIRSYNKDKTSIKKIYYSQLIISFMIVAPLTLCAFFLTPIVISNFLTQYIDAIIISKILIASILLLPVTFVSGSTFNILDLQTKYLFFQVLTILLNIFMSIIFINYNLGINGVALATFLSFLIYSLFLIFYLTQYIFNEKNKSK